ncbi:MAG TPA: tripartite tricarboxylate transporter TctB family protein [Usitatibacter sp.]|nr:tripartite tricarboxylate transporter TctB family protein [Usitatibacter sp.]
MMLRAGDFWAGLAFAALGAWIVSEARGWVYLGDEGPGAGFFPMWYGVAMIALALVLAIGAARKTRGRTPGWVVGRARGGRSPAGARSRRASRC